MKTLKNTAAITEKDFVSFAEAIVTTQRMLWDVTMQLIKVSLTQPQYIPRVLIILETLRSMDGAFFDGLEMGSELTWLAAAVGKKNENEAEKIILKATAESSIFNREKG